MDLVLQPPYLFRVQGVPRICEKLDKYAAGRLKIENRGILIFKDCSNILNKENVNLTILGI